MTGTDWQARVREALTRTQIMALSTLDRDGGSWTSPVQYQWDSQLNLYFASMPDARHVGNLRRDARVSAAIYSFPGPPGGNLGLQLRGIATAIGPAGDQGPWLRFTIKPEEAWCFDSRIDRQRHRIDLSSLDLGPA
jgi:Pyridoxamine 5'-phosphate oxidase